MRTRFEDPFGWLGLPGLRVHSNEVVVEFKEAVLFVFSSAVLEGWPVEPDFFRPSHKVSVQSIHHVYSVFLASAHCFSSWTLSDGTISQSTCQSISQSCSLDFI